MLVSDLLAHLSTFDPSHMVIGQYHDSNGSWPIVPVTISKVPGQNTMVVIQCLPPDLGSQETD